MVWRSGSHLGFLLAAILPTTPWFFPIFLRFPPDLRSVGLARRRLSTSLSALPAAARDFVEEAVRLCRPREVLLCDGSEEEGKELLRGLQDDGVLHPLPKYDNW